MKKFATKKIYKNEKDWRYIKYLSIRMQRISDQRGWFSTIGLERKIKKHYIDVQRKASLNYYHKNKKIILAKRKSRIYEINESRKKIYLNDPDFYKYLKYTSYRVRLIAEKRGWYFLNYNKKEINIDMKKFDYNIAYISALKAISSTIIATKKICYLDESLQLKDIHQECLIRCIELSGNLIPNKNKSSYFFAISRNVCRTFLHQNNLKKLIDRLNEY